MPADSMVMWGLLGLQIIFFTIMVFGFGVRVGQGRKFAAFGRFAVLVVLVTTISVTGVWMTSPTTITEIMKTLEKG